MYFSLLVFCCYSRKFYLNPNFLRVITTTINFTIRIFFYFLQKQPLRGVLRKGVLKTCSKFTGEHPCRSVISIKLLCNFFNITLRHGCSPVNLLCVFRVPFSKKASGGLFLFLFDEVVYLIYFDAF